jgi:hypothetical protein
MKYCKKCDTSKSESEFSPRMGKLQPYCKPCNREYQRQHYKQNKENYKAVAKKSRDTYRKKAYNFLIEYAKDGCIICGESDFRCLEFDHINPEDKAHTISRMIQEMQSIDNIKLELTKCRVMCCNCHRKHTAEQFGWYKML